MAYIINRFDGTQLTIVDDGVLDNTTPLGLIGRNYTGYGEVQNENFIFLLENFANQSPPTRSIRGQVWYDTVGKALKVYNGTDWLSIGNATVAEIEPGHSSGGLWLKSTTKQLYISDGTTWRLVGPEGVEGFSTTKLTSTKLKSTTNIFYPVILSEINGETVAILSNDTFTISADNAILGFEQLNKGINLKSDSSFSGSLRGNATSATRLETPRTINEVAFNGTSNIVITATTNQPLTPGDYIIGSEFSGAFADTWNIDATPINSVGKIVARDSTGSFSATTITAGEFTGTLLGNVISLEGTSEFDKISVNDITGRTFSGLAARATQLSARRTINTVPFDGTEDIILPVPAETLTGNTLAPNIVNSSLTTLGKLEYLETEAPGIKVGDGNNLLFYIEGFTPTIESETTDILKLKLKTGSASAAPTTVTFLSASAASADGVGNPALVPDYTISTDINNRPVLGLPSYRWRNIYSKEATLDGLKTTTISGRTVADQVTFTNEVIVNGRLYGSVTGNITGNVTGSASLNVLKSGDTMSGDLTVGSITKTSNSIISVRAGDSYRAGFEAYGSDQGTGYLYIGQSTSYGGGLSYNGDVSPAFIPGELPDRVTFFRRNAGTDTVVFEYPYDSNTVTFKGTVEGVFSGNGSAITNINASNIATGTLNPLRLSGSYNINVVGNVTGNLSGNVTGNLSGNVTGNLTGTVTGSSTLNVLKAGDTMTGDLTIQKANAWISLDSPSDGTEGTNQAAGISIGESGYKGSATLHMTYTGDGYSHIGMGSINGATSLPQYEAIRLYYLDNTVRVLGNMTVAGTASGTFSGTGTSLDINAERLIMGNIPVGRLSGTYNISISGVAANATNAVYATNSGTASAATVGNSIKVTDSRSTVTTPQSINMGVVFDFKQNTTDGLSDGGTYFGEMTFRQYGSGSDWSGGLSHQLGFTDNTNIWHRAGSGSSWNSWRKLLDSSNFNSYSPTLTGTGASGTWPINVSGQSQTVASITSAQVTTALGYTPVNPSALTNQAGSAASFSSGTFTGDIVSGTTTKASNTVISVRAGDGHRAGFEAYGDNQGTGYLYVGQSTSYGGGIAYNGDGSPGFINGETADKVTFFRRSAGTDYEVFSYWYYGDTVEFNGNVTAPSFTGNLTGNVTGNVSGQAGTVASISSSQIVTALGYTPVNPSTLSNQSGAAGSFSTVTATSSITVRASNPQIYLNDTGDTGIDIAIGSFNEGFSIWEPEDPSAPLTPGGGREFFRIDDDGGVAYVFGDAVLDAGNYTTYVPTKTGTGASGTWPISITGNAATVTTLTSGQIVSALGYTPANGSGAGNINGDQNYQDNLLRRPTIIDYSLYHNALGNVSGSTTVNLESGNYVSATAVGAVTWTFSNPPTGLRVGSIIMELTNGGSYTQYWPASVRWPSGVAPTLASSGVDVLVFLTDDAGSNWRGAISMGDSR